MANQLGDGELECHGSHGGHGRSGDLFRCRQAMASFLALAKASRLYCGAGPKKMEACGVVEQPGHGEP